MLATCTGNNPPLYKSVSSRQCVHLGYMCSLTLLLTHEPLLYSNLPKWNIVLLRSHHCQIHKSCSKQRWNFKSWSVYSLGCWSVISYLNLLDTNGRKHTRWVALWPPITDRAHLYQMRSQAGSCHHHLTEKIRNTFSPSTSCKFFFFPPCIPHLSVIWLAGGLLWPQDACCAPLHPPLSTDVLLCLNVSHFLLFFQRTICN